MGGWCVKVRADSCRDQKRPSDPLVSGVTGDCEHPTQVLGAACQSSARVTSAFNHWAISLAQYMFLKLLCDSNSLLPSFIKKLWIVSTVAPLQLSRAVCWCNQSSCEVEHTSCHTTASQTEIFAHVGLLTKEVQSEHMSIQGCQLWRFKTRLARLFCILRYTLEGFPNTNNKHVLVYS